MDYAAGVSLIPLKAGITFIRLRRIRSLQTFIRHFCGELDHF